MQRATVCVVTGLITIIAGAGATALAQQQAGGGVEVTVTVRPLAQNVVLPQRRVFIAQPRPGVRPTPAPAQVGRVVITGVTAKVRIDRQVATTTLDIALHNPTGQRLEAEVVLPVPETAAVRGFDFQGAGAEPSAQLLRREEARALYDSIVSQTRDPALLEFIGYNLIRSSVFPVEPGGTQKVRLTYEHVCPADGDRVDYVLPRTEAIDCTIPWEVTVELVSERKIATVYSPSHAIEQKPGQEGKYVWLKIADGARTEPGSFRVSYLMERGELSVSVLAYPDAKVGGGYFMLLAGLPADAAKDRPAIKREVTLVLDRSGSMNGPKLEQVREAAKQVLAGLDDGELFNVIVYNEAVEAFSDRPVAKTADTIGRARAYLDAMTARGGTNIHDALVEALRQKPTDGALPIVLFLTDGLPTIGERSEKAIRELATRMNPHKRRVFTFGVGVDVNSPLLENIAYQSRAAATFVLPDEDVEVKVGSMFRRLSGPVVTEPMLAASTHWSVHGTNNARERVIDVMPVRLPDLFEGDQLVLLGRYTGDAPFRLDIMGVRGDKRGVVAHVNFDPGVATTRHAFVPRIWAARKIGVLIDAIRTSGADPATAASDPKMKELVDEIVRLSTEFGILTEYTAFFAREGTNLADAPGLARAAQEQLRQRAVGERSGLGSISQDANSAGRKSADKLNYRNGYWTQKMEQAAAGDGVQQVSDRSLWKQNGRWIDGKLASRADAAEPKADRTVEFGSKAYFDLAHQLAAANRNGVYAVDGDALVEVDGQAVLVKAPAQN